MEPFASFIKTTPKHVVTSSAPADDWDLKAGPGGDIGIHGSIALAQSLLRARLVDELRLVVAPVVAGRGRRLFDGDDELQRLELIDVTSSPNGTLFLAFRA